MQLDVQMCKDTDCFDMVNMLSSCRTKVNSNYIQQITARMKNLRKRFLKNKELHNDHDFKQIDKAGKLEEMKKELVIEASCS
jgi:hypothetical protein